MRKEPMVFIEEVLISGKKFRLYFNEDIAEFYIWDNKFFLDYSDGDEKEFENIEELKNSIAKHILNWGWYSPDLDNDVFDYSSYNLNIIRWMGAFRYTSDINEAIKFEFSSPRERAGEFVTTGKIEGFEFDPFVGSFASIKKCQIGMIYNGSDINRLYSVDVSSEPNDEGKLIPSRFHDCLIAPEEDEIDQDIWERAMISNRESVYVGHKEAFIKKEAIPKGIFIKRDSIKIVPFIKKFFENQGIQIPIFITRGSDPHLTVIKGDKISILKYDY